MQTAAKPAMKFVFAYVFMASTQLCSVSGDIVPPALAFKNSRVGINPVGAGDLTCQKLPLLDAPLPVPPYRAPPLYDLPPD